MKRYYFDESCDSPIYSTIWTGMLNCVECTIPISENYYQKSNRELDDLLADICDVNFYITINENTIYFSVCQDFRYYYHDFEKHIKKVINAIEEKFSIKIINGEFSATEIIHKGTQYKYTITKNDNGSISLKKRVLNWSSYEKKSKKDDNISEITTKIKDITII